MENALKRQIEFGWCESGKLLSNVRGKGTEETKTPKISLTVPAKCFQSTEKFLYSDILSYFFIILSTDLVSSEITMVLFSIIGCFLQNNCPTFLNEILPLIVYLSLSLSACVHASFFLFSFCHSDQSNTQQNTFVLYWTKKKQWEKNQGLRYRKQEQMHVFYL